jgi:hypothetical protein
MYMDNTLFALAVVTLVNDLRLVMIIMEVLRTVLSYRQERATSLQAFLLIAAISATPRILARQRRCHSSDGARAVLARSSRDRRVRTEVPAVRIEHEPDRMPDPTPWLEESPARSNF